MSSSERSCCVSREIVVQPSSCSSSVRRMDLAEVMLSKYGVFSLTRLFLLKTAKIFGRVHNRTSVSPQASVVHTLLNTAFSGKSRNKKKGEAGSLPSHRKLSD